MRDIQASVEVRALIGAEKLHELQEDAFARYECWQCGRTGRMTELTSVIVLGYGVFRAVRLTHASCADSQVIEIDAAGMTAVASESAGRKTASTPGEQAGGFAAARTALVGGCPA